MTTRHQITPQQEEAFVPYKQQMVAMSHPKIKADARVPASSTEHYEAKGWKVSDQPKIAEAQAKAAEAEADDTAPTTRKKG